MIEEINQLKGNSINTSSFMYTESSDCLKNH